MLFDNLDVRDLALDATHLYWTTADGELAKWPLDGSSDPITLASSTGAPTRVAVDAEFVYWTNAGNPGGVMKVPLGGGVPTSLVTGYQVIAIAVSSTAVYWADINALRLVPKVGGSIVTVADGYDGFLREVDAVAVDGTYVYWNANGPHRRPLVGGTPSQWDAGGLGPGSLVVDSANVYWTVGPLLCDFSPCKPDHQGLVMRAPLNGGATTMLARFATPSYSVTPLAVDATHLYWMTADSIQRLALDGSGTVETIAEHQGNPHALVLSDSHVCWSSGPVGEFPAAIRAMPK